MFRLPISPVLFVSTWSLLLALAGTGPARAADWPPTLDATNVTTKADDGRKIERFTHGPRPSWQYSERKPGEWDFHPGQETGVAQQNHNSFYVVSPKNPRPNAPLCVVLHSANRTAYDYIGFALLGRQIENREDPKTVMTNSPDDFYSLYLNSTNDEWWGYGQTHKNEQRHINTPPPAELRALDTIEWVATKYQIDRNRIYLCGVSMGGCGTLGIGMSHGEVFAAIRAEVPAGTGYASYRWGGFAPSPAVDAPADERAGWIRRASGAGLQDPPVIVDFSSEQDNWAMTQPALVQAAQVGRLPLVLCWGPFGHATFGSLIAKYPICDTVLQYPWLEIRKNEAYPVFTHASTDERCPWLNAPAEFDSSGQLNGWFRWKNERDKPGDFAMQLWIAHPEVKTPPSMPNKATADITLRRLQGFEIGAGRSYIWKTSRAGRQVASGRATADALRLLTIPNVELVTEPTDLTVQEDGP